MPIGTFANLFRIGIKRKKRTRQLYPAPQKKKLPNKLVILQKKTLFNIAFFYEDKYKNQVWIKNHDRIMSFRK